MNDFQTWLSNQGYYRNEGSLIWWKDDKIVGGSELSKKLDEYKCQYQKNDIEKLVQEYFGLKSDIKEDFEIITDFGVIVNLLAMFKDKNI